MTKQDAFALEEVDDDGIEPGFYDLGSILPPGLSEQEAVIALDGSYFVGADGYDRSGIDLRNPFGRIDPTMAIDLLFDVPQVSPTFHNGAVSADVNNDGVVAPADALAVINQMNAIGRGELPVLELGDDWPSMFYDVTNDGFLSPLDALIVINLMDSGIDVNGNPFSISITAVPEPGTSFLVLASFAIVPFWKRRHQ